MNIGIIGPPGAGKSSLAWAIRRETGYSVLDNYVQKIQRDTDLALGPWASFNENFMVAGYRRAQELKVRQQRTNVVTVGTILDTLMYCAMRSDAILQGAWPENRPFAEQWVTAAMPAMGLWYRETWDYDVAVFCPAGEKAENWQTNYSNEMPGVFSSFNVQNVTRKTDETLEYIVAQIEKTDESGV